MQSGHGVIITKATPACTPLSLSEGLSANITFSFGIAPSRPTTSASRSQPVAVNALPCSSSLHLPALETTAQNRHLLVAKAHPKVVEDLAG